MISSALITCGWGWLIYTGNIGTIWPMFGVANQILAVLALALVTTWLVNTGRGRYAFVTILPMLWVMTTTLTAGKILIFTVFHEAIDRGRAEHRPDGVRHHHGSGAGDLVDGPLAGCHAGSVPDTE
jgi:carbon starvation protein